MIAKSFDTEVQQLKALLQQVEEHPQYMEISSEVAKQITEAKQQLQTWEFFDPEPGDEQILQEMMRSLDAILQNQNAASVEKEWTTPLPLLPRTPSVPRMTPDMLPLALRDWLVDEAKRLDVPLGMVAVPAIISAGALIGRSVGIYPKALDTSWAETANLYGMVVAPPSFKKSPSFKAGMVHIKRLQRDMIEQHQQDQVEREVQRQITEMEIEKLKGEAKKKSGTPTSIQKDLLEKTEALQALDVPEPRLYINDTTVEQLAILLQDNSKGLMCYRDELEGLFKTIEKPGREGDRAFFLEAWAGTSDYSVDRVSRKSLYIPAVNLSIMGSIQPDVLAPHIRGATNGSKAADGFLQRFQLLLWVDPVRDVKYIDQLPDQAALDRTFAIYKGLHELDPASLGAAPDPSTKIPMLHFEPDAQEVFVNWYVSLLEEAHSPEFRDAPAYQAHLGKLGTLMARLALIFHLVEVIGGETPSPVSLEAAELAIRWTDFFKAHARKVYANEIETGVHAAYLLVEKIEAGEVSNGQHLRDLYRRNWPGLKTKEEVCEALTVLEAHGWARLEKQETGSRPKEVIRLNPALTEWDELM